MLDEQEEKVVEQIRDLIGEHFTNYAFCVVTEDGGLFYDFKDRFVGKALFIAAQEDMDSDTGVEDMILDWDEMEDDDGESFL